MARTEKLLQEVKQECIDLGLHGDKIILCQGDVTDTSDLLRIRNTIETGEFTADHMYQADQQNGMELIRSIY